MAYLDLTKAPLPKEPEYPATVWSNQAIMGVNDLSNPFGTNYITQDPNEPMKYQEAPADYTPLKPSDQLAGMPSETEQGFKKYMAMYENLMNQGYGPSKADIAKQKQLDEQAKAAFGAYQKKLSDQALEDRQRLQSILETRKPTLDISPLMQLSDQWFGGNLSRGYKPATTAEEIQKESEPLRTVAEGLEQKVAGGEVSNIQMQAEKLREAMNRKEDTYRKNLDLKMKAADNLMDTQIKWDMFNRKEKGTLSKQDEAALKRLSTDKDVPKMQFLVDAKDKLNTYDNLVKKYGVQGVGDKAMELQTAYTDFIIAAKDKFGLGALAGPDMDLLASYIRSAGGPDAYMKQYFMGRNPAAIQNQVALIKRAYKQAFDRMYAYKTNSALYKGTAAINDFNILKNQFYGLPIDSGLQGSAPTPTPSSAPQTNGPLPWEKGFKY